MMKHKNNGFTLIEVLIAVAIISILASVAYPSYVNQINKSRRSDGHLALLSAAQQLERCKTTSFTYAGCNVITGSSESPEKFYKLSIDNLTATAYELTATPQNQQVGDVDCGSLTLDENATRTASGPSGAACW
jgi:type IV pilus assembly protein PilE